MSDSNYVNPAIHEAARALYNPDAGQSQLKSDDTRAYEIFSSQSKFLLGKVLTTIDAAVTDKQQNKAVKDIIKQQFRDQEKWVYRICCDGHLICTTGEDMPPT
jgi:hypothetical protein